MSEWSLHAETRGLHGGMVWVCRGKYNCYNGTGGEFHRGFAVHDGAEWFWDDRPWVFWRPTRQHAFAKARQFLERDAECRRRAAEMAREIEADTTARASIDKLLESL